MQEYLCELKDGKHKLTGSYDFILAHQWYILARSPEYFLAFARKLVTEPLQLAPDFLTLPGLLLPFTLPSAKFSITNSLALISLPDLLYASVLQSAHQLDQL